MLRALRIFKLNRINKLAVRGATQDCKPCGEVMKPVTNIDVLGNNIRVATEERCSCPLACVSIFIRGGPRYEAPCNNGMYHFLEHMAFAGFNSLRKNDIQSVLLDKGGSLSVTTRREMQSYNAVGLASSYEQLFEILTKVITDLEFNEQEMEEAKKTISLEGQDADTDAKRLCFDYLHQCAFNGTALGQSVMGPSCNYDRFYGTYLQNFVAMHYQPWKMVVASAGGICHEKMKSMTQNYLGNLKVTQCEYPFKDNRYTGSQIMFRDDSMQYAHVAIAIEAPGYMHEDYMRMLVGKNLVGSWDRTQPWGREVANPLARACAGSDSCDMYEAFYLAYKDVGLWGVYFVGRKMTLENTLYLIQDYWMKMATMVTDGEIQRAISATMLELAKKSDSVINACQDIGKQVLYTGHRLDYKLLVPKVIAMKGFEIRTVMMEYAYDKCPAVAAVGPTENLPEYTRIRAGMYWLRL